MNGNYDINKFMKEHLSKDRCSFFYCIRKLIRINLLNTDKKPAEILKKKLEDNKKKRGCRG